MLRNLPAWQKNVLRLLAWTGAIAVLWAVWQDAALAQGAVGVANTEDDGFFGNLFRNIFLFDSDGLFATLQKPTYAIPAFVALNVIIFVETGLLIGFFLPGDSLLVITGMILARDDCRWSMPLLLVTLCASAIIGDTVGYWIGYKSGPKIFSREKSFFFAKDHLLKAQAFYEKHGGRTIILARFVPFLRTFAPVVAGVGKMDYKQFLSYNVFGGIGWILSMVFAGYFLPTLLNPILQQVFDPLLAVESRPFRVEKHIEKVVLLVVFLSVTPLIFAWIKSKLAARRVEPTSEMMQQREALSVK
ncbi:MAG: VTT domain-containing protein [Planctomycetes bacterium]|nr:VTT domain-containing protein [Planctomycetota bacterium]